MPKQDSKSRKKNSEVCTGSMKFFNSASARFVMFCVCTDRTCIPSWKSSNYTRTTHCHGNWFIRFCKWWVIISYFLPSPSPSPIDIRYNWKKVKATRINKNCSLITTVNYCKFGFKLKLTIGYCRSRDQGAKFLNQKNKSFFPVLHPMQIYKR